MSGHGGGGGGGDNGGVDCASFFARTTLSSPNPAVIVTLAVDDILDLRIPDPQIPRILAIATGGNTAGSVTVGRQAELVACIRAGVEFIARALSISGGACEVEIRPKATP